MVILGKIVLVLNDLKINFLFYHRASGRANGKAKIKYADTDEDEEEEDDFEEDEEEEEIPLKKRKLAKQGKGRPAPKPKEPEVSQATDRSPSNLYSQIPPVAEMVPTAIRALRDNPRKGSSLSAIKGFMAEEWGINVQTYAPKIKKYLLSSHFGYVN